MWTTVTLDMSTARSAVTVLTGTDSLSSAVTRSVLDCRHAGVKLRGMVVRDKLTSLNERHI